jgi:hypothetical protein
MNLATSVYQVCQQDTTGHSVTSFFSAVKFLYFLLNWMILNRKPAVFVARLRVRKIRDLDTV